MKICTYNECGEKHSETEYQIDVPDYVSMFLKDRVALNLSQDDIRIIEGNKSCKKILLVNKLRLIIKNDYENFVEYVNSEKLLDIFDNNVFGNNDKLALSLSECFDNLKLLKSYTSMFMRNIEEFNKLESHISSINNDDNATRKFNTAHKNLLRTRSQLSELSNRIIVKLREIKNISECKCEIEELDGSFSDDSFIVFIAKLINSNVHKRVFIYSIMHSLEMIKKSKEFCDSPSQSQESISLHHTNTPLTSFVVKQEKRNDKIKWTIHLDNKEIISLILLDNTSYVISELKDKLETGYNDYYRENGENSEEFIRQSFVHYTKDFNPSNKQLEDFYFYWINSLVDIYKLNEKTLYSIPIIHYIVLVKNDVINELYRFHDVFVKDILSTSSQEISDIDFYDLYSKMFELNCIKKKLGITNYNNAIQTQIVKLDAEKEATSKVDALNKILLFLEPILNDKYLKNDKHKDKVKNLIKDIILSEAISDIIFKKSHKGFKCFYLKLVLNIIGFLFNQTDIGITKPDNGGAAIFRGNAYDLIGTLITHHKLAINQNNFSKYIRDYNLDDSALTEEMKFEIKRLYKKFFE